MYFHKAFNPIIWTFALIGQWTSIGLWLAHSCDRPVHYDWPLAVIDHWTVIGLWLSLFSVLLLVY